MLGSRSPSAVHSIRAGGRSAPRTPNAERRTPNAERRTPNAERRTPNAERRTPNDRTALRHSAVELRRRRVAKPGIASALGAEDRWFESSRPDHSSPSVAVRAVNIADLRRLAQRRLPRIVFDYADGGAEDEITLRDNCRVFDTIRLRPRNGVQVPRADLRTTVLGTTFDLPFLLAPIGSTRMFY